VDTTLRRRSIKPLTRQQIRDIIDRNAVSLRAAGRNGTIRTSNQLYGSLPDAEKTRRAGKREEATEARFRQAAVDENRSITLFQATRSRPKASSRPPATSAKRSPTPS
jgi:hypothetical protein